MYTRTWAARGALALLLSYLLAGASPAQTFRGSDGKDYPIGEWPAEADGMRIGYVEKAGKKFFASRVIFDGRDIPLAHEVLIDPPRHMGYGKRFGPEPVLFEDETARNLIEDIIAKNPEQRDQLWGIRDRIKGRPGEGAKA